MTTTTFETAKIGDRVWSVEYGWGAIQSILHSYTNPIQVKFAEDVCKVFTLSGSRLPWCKTQTLQTLFWDEVVIKAPVKPLPEIAVDTKVIVWNNGESKSNRYFSHFSGGQIECFADGKTSWTTTRTTGWTYWELAE